MGLESLDITSTRLYAERGYPWPAWDTLRREAPVYRYETPDHDPFWAVTRHADVLTVSRRSDVFVNSGRLRIFSKLEDHMMREGSRGRAAAFGWDVDEPLDMVFMDDPRHREFRSLTAPAFTPGVLRKLEDRMGALARQFAGELETELRADAEQGRATNLVTAFSTKLPQAIICEMLGLPGGDWPKLLQWTNALVGAADDEFLEPGEEPILAAARAVDLLRDYFLAWIEGCRRDGVAGHGLSTALLDGRVAGAALTEQQLQGYFTLILAAGSETARNAATGGVHALLEHPSELERLVRDPSLLGSAVEEILRWTSPVIQFARTAVTDFELSGVRIRAGEDVAMFYPSANRDEAVFPEPYRFDVARSPNYHLAFGHGAHFCLGSNLARQELRAMLAALLPLLPELELAGRPELVPHLHVGGIKKLLVRHSPRH
ncbi:MAG: cytochrome P450 [Deltaproteobacteria bacterium]|nr:cytochrome P450 [Deltaproteobacteria bacterium]